MVRSHQQIDISDPIALDQDLFRMAFDIARQQNPDTRVLD